MRRLLLAMIATFVLAIPIWPFEAHVQYVVEDKPVVPPKIVPLCCAGHR